jgi:hypothetical protein
MMTQIGEVVLLWFVLFIGFWLLFYGLMSGLEYLMELWRNNRKQHIDMAHEVNNLNASLLGTMYDLHTDSMAARQALIRESFIAAQSELNKQPDSAEVIEPDSYE